MQIPRTWGSVARRGARSLAGSDTEIPRRDERNVGPPSPRREEVWILEDNEEAKSLGVGRPRISRRSFVNDEVVLPDDVVEELAGAVGRGQARKIAAWMARAARAYERDRYPEALRITRTLVDQVPESAAARELHGLVCYRLGRWREASSHLEAARSLSGDDPNQTPIIMDCRRALGQHRKVETLWEELRSSSPPADVLVEGRLVAAAHRADQGDLDSAIELLESAGAARNLRRPAARHLRQWYLLGDLYERAGDLPRAREMFTRVAKTDPDLADAAERLSDLGRSARPDRRGHLGSSGRPGSGGAAGRHRRSP